MVKHNHSLFTILGTMVFLLAFSPAVWAQREGQEEYPFLDLQKIESKDFAVDECISPTTGAYLCLKGQFVLSYRLGNGEMRARVIKYRLDKDLEQRVQLSFGRHAQMFLDVINNVIPTLLNHTDARQRLCAAYILIISNKASHEANTIITKTLKDEDKKLARDAVRLLAVLGAKGEWAIKDLIPMLQEGYTSRLDPLYLLQEAVIMALSAMGAKATPAIPTLLNIISKKKALAQSAISALGHIGRVDTLIDLLKNPDSEIRMMAINSLEDMGEVAAPAVPALISLLSDPQAQMAAIATLGHIGPAAQSAVPALEELAEKASTNSLIVEMVKGALKKIKKL